MIDIFSDVVAALRFLLMGTSDAVAAADAELLARTPQELYELVLLIRLVSFFWCNSAKEVGQAGPASLQFFQRVIATIANGWIVVRSG